MQSTLRKKLANGASTYGLWVTVESPSVTEIAVGLGLDWVCVDMEHGHLDFGDLLAHLRAAVRSDTAVIARIPDSQFSYVKRALDLGADAIIVPYVRGISDVKRAVEYAKYPPDGIRGIGGDRAFGWGLRTAAYLQSANRETLVIPLIETREAVQDLEAILEVPEVEAVFTGPADLTASYGSTGEWETQETAEVVRSIHGSALQANLCSGIMAQSIDDAKERRDQGYRMIAIGADMKIMLATIKNMLDELRR